MRAVGRLVMAFLVAGACFAEEPLRVSGIFTNHMVLQRDAPIRVWGTAAACAPVTVELAGHSASASPDEQGRWEAVLPALAAGGPHTLRVSNGQTLEFRDILMGDVWLCSGQSNMAWPVDEGPFQVVNAAQERANANWPEIRLFSVAKANSETAGDTVDGTGWAVCSPDTVGSFSAVGYFFGRAIHRHAHIPVGLIDSSYGGTTVEAWTSEAGLRTVPHMAALLDAWRQHPELRGHIRKTFDEEFGAWLGRLNDSDAGYAGGEARWASPDFDASSWATMRLPQLWEEAGYPDLDGLMWFRREVSLPESSANRPVRLHFPRVNDRLQVWFNGTLVVPWATSAQPGAGHPVPAECVRGGRNVVALRIYDMGNNGGLSGRGEELWLKHEGSEDAVPLAGDWACRPGFRMKEFPPVPRAPVFHPDNPNAPSGLFNAMIAPLTRFPIKGAIWYQGEANAKRAEEYRDLFPALIRDWRAHWSQGEFPFLFVQLANFRAVQPEPVDEPWAELREAQAMALTLPNTGMAVTIDLGVAEDVHPRNKQDVGERLTLAARRVAYGESLVYSGPVMREAVREGARMRVRFDHAGGGLVAKGGGALKGFAVAGADRRFHWAEAVVDGDTVVVWRDDVPEPVAARYAWADNPACNLYNAEGLPAAPFRTDNWPGVTAGKKLTLPPQ